MVSKLSLTDIPVRPSPPKRAENKLGPSRRPRYGRATNTIHSRQATPYERAVDRAAALGIAFVFLTIWWDGTNHPCRDLGETVRWMREAQRKWLKARGIEFYDLWAVEIGAVKGQHLHQLVHCPAHLRKAFDAYVRGLLSPVRKGAVQIRKPPRMADCEGCHQPRDWQHLARRYFLKGSTDTVRQRNGIDHCASASPEAAEVYAQDQGTIQGKRLGYSRSLGDKANRIRVAGGVRLKNYQTKSDPIPAADAV